MDSLADSKRGANAASVVAPVARWRAAFIAAFCGLLCVKVLIAATLSPFGDEAFYWQESRHLAWGYSDLPPLTAWLIGVGEDVAGHGLLGMRWPFLLIGSALPWITVAFARRAFDVTAGWQAGLLCLALPLAGSLGVLALPDVPLTVAIMVATYALLEATAHSRLRDWLMLGVALAIAWLTHYRAAMPMLAGLAFVVVTRRGRRLWSRPGLWIAMLVASTGLIPLIVSNWQQRGAGLAFQLIERNPWQFHADALVQPLEQAAACTPLLYAFMLWAGWRCWQRRHQGGPWDVIAAVSVTIVVVYFVAGLFADDTRFRAHWPLPGYLPVLAALPVLLREANGTKVRALAMTAYAIAALGQVVCMTYLALAAIPGGAGVLAGFKAFPANFVGWREAAATTTSLLSTRPSDILVADNFMLAAELDFALNGQRPIFVLDSPLNVKHGRAPQLAIWQRDERSFRTAAAGRSMLLVVDQLALRERERKDWLGSICSRVAGARLLTQLSMYDGRKRIAFYAASVPTATVLPRVEPETCVVWRDAWLAASAGD